MKWNMDLYFNFLGYAPDYSIQLTEAEWRIYASVI